MIVNVSLGHVFGVDAFKGEILWKSESLGNQMIQIWPSGILLNVLRLYAKMAWSM